MKVSNPIEDLSPALSGTGNCSGLGLPQMSVWCLMALLNPAVMCVVLKYPYQRCAKNVKASLILYSYSVCGFDRIKLLRRKLLGKRCKKCLFFSDIV